ncbi:Molybdopterin binding motif, CinA N-terminal domain / C-terminal domain of CinA type S [hydrothermal vent metagenome]|uniref:Molybdopterin binding motif, CinA N-terminal domain / C-terminal domain of CinA type S n=1 Tax=hydrothermal vent metagenome TaxID=652676 RepID=A0A1W1CEH8_9ZZZZ
MNEAKQIIDYLTKHHQTISFAESCTGGRIASAFTAISGASAVLNGSCVTYSNDIKEQWLGVKHQTLLDHGAVSKKCVKEMLIGIRDMANSHYAIAVSGIAGPTGGTADKPVGTVYIGILTPNTSSVKLYNFNGNREEIQQKATISAIGWLKEEIELSR